MVQDKSGAWIEKLRPFGREKIFSTGEHITWAGEPADCFYYVASGEIRLYKQDPAGRELEVRRVSTGDLFAEVLAFAGDRYPVSSQAVRESKVVEFETARVLEQVEVNPQLARFFIRIFAERCLYLNRKIEMLTMMELPERLTRYLLSLVKSDSAEEDEVMVQLPVSKRELAVQLGSVPETVSRALRKLQDQGYIVVSRNTIRIKSLRRIKQLINDDLF